MAIEKVYLWKPNKATHGNQEMFTIFNMRDFSDWLAGRLKELDLKQIDLVDATGASKGTVSKWMKGPNVPSRKFVKKLAKVLQMESEDLIEIMESNGTSLYKLRTNSNISHAVQESNRITQGGILAYSRSQVMQLPILNSAQAISPAESIAAGDVQGFLGVPISMKPGANSFYFQIDDDSMFTLDRQIFRRGTLALIDPDKPIEPGCFVLAKVYQKQRYIVVFRAYLERETEDEFEAFDLAPLNTAVKNISIKSADQGEIIGVLSGIYTPADNLRFNS